MSARRVPRPRWWPSPWSCLVAGCSLDDDEQKAADSLEPTLVTHTSERGRARRVPTASPRPGSASRRPDPLVKAGLLSRGLEAGVRRSASCSPGTATSRAAVAAGLAAAPTRVRRLRRDLAGPQEGAPEGVGRGARRVRRLPQGRRPRRLGEVADRVLHRHRGHRTRRVPQAASTPQRRCSTAADK